MPVPVSVCCTRRSLSSTCSAAQNCREGRGRFFVKFHTKQQNAESMQGSSSACWRLSTPSPASQTSSCPIENRTTGRLCAEPLKKSSRLAFVGRERAEKKGDQVNKIPKNLSIVLPFFYGSDSRNIIQVFSSVLLKLFDVL